MSAEPTVKSARKMAGTPVACGASERILSAAKYKGMIAASPSTISRTMNRTLSRWSPNSLAAITRHPERGMRICRSARGRRWRRPGARSRWLLRSRLRPSVGVRPLTLIGRRGRGSRARGRDAFRGRRRFGGRAWRGHRRRARCTGRRGRAGSGARPPPRTASPADARPSHRRGLGGRDRGRWRPHRRRLGRGRGTGRHLPAPLDRGPVDVVE